MDNFVAVDVTLRIPIISKGLSLRGLFPTISDNEAEHSKNLEYIYMRI